MLFYNEIDFAAGAAMSRADNIAVLEYLEGIRNDGATIITWNGTFDMENLAIESGEISRCAALALDSWDIMFQLFCIKGFPLSLDTAAKGMGLPGKTEGMHGDLAPVMWKESHEKRMKVLEYVGQDVITTLDVGLAVMQANCMEWTSKSGKPMRVAMRPMTVRECLRLPEADNSWMSNPIPKSQFYTWFANESEGNNE
jgi:predicted PolB exonuclease-like 3'-5' exonuclease